MRAASRAGILGAITLLLGAVLSLGALGVPSAEAAPWTAVSAANSGLTTSAVTSTGGAECWGNNSNGRLGNGTNTNSSVPVPVNGLSSGVSAISTGNDHACALTSTGGVECWGYNGYGQLGNGTTTDSSIPVAVKGLSSGVTAVSAGGDDTSAITSTGDVDCWGDNVYGELGNGDTENSFSPLPVRGLSSGVRAISASYDATSALTNTGGVECWGDNSNGQLGNGTNTNSSLPVPVSGLSSGVSAISAGYDDTSALTSTGGIECWGENTYGQLGNGTTTDSSIPVAVNGLSSGISAVSAGGTYTCALTSTGGVECWGDNTYGQLGNGTTTDSLIPVAVSGLSSGVSAISAGTFFACALPRAGGVECWGLNDYGQLGNGTTTDSSVPVSALVVVNTTVALPSNGAVSSNIWLDATAYSLAGIASVSFEVSGGSITDQVVSSSVSWEYGWLGAWDTTDVPNGTYMLQSVATDNDGNTVDELRCHRHRRERVAGHRGPRPLQRGHPQRVRRRPRRLGGRNQRRHRGPVRRERRVPFGPGGRDPVATIYGWIAFWNTTPVANGPYTLQSVATETGGTTAMSPPIDVTVANGET